MEHFHQLNGKRALLEDLYDSPLHIHILSTKAFDITKSSGLLKTVKLTIIPQSDHFFIWSSSN